MHSYPQLLIHSYPQLLIHSYPQLLMHSYPQLLIHSYPQLLLVIVETSIEHSVSYKDTRRKIVIMYSLQLRMT